MVVSKMNKDAQMRAAINQKLIETGERERLKELLRAKLIECGWKDQLKAHCKEVIKEKGLEHVTVDDLVAEITPKGRGKEYGLSKETSAADKIFILFC
ncbi:PREDICTED: transcription and mRNA export factor ENY2 [Propithecus coquereli]|uniref:transcription and mRNA export factor ENY2 n=1 Tax=Propithecus coquereli TaxID=379532 RepID=UPI00063F0500|nr:PREDICTED: transcription and mRNA export factor ENY2 [Propithecus coquereli]